MFDLVLGMIRGVVVVVFPLRDGVIDPRGGPKFGSRSGVGTKVKGGKGWVSVGKGFDYYYDCDKIGVRDEISIESYRTITSNIRRVGH